MHARSFSFSTPSQPVRPTRCYHCAHDFLVSLRAQTLTCPRCTTRLNLADLVVRGSHIASAISTAGKLTVPLRASLQAESVHAMAGFECLGSAHADLRTIGPAYLGPRAVFTGSLHAAELVVSPGARIVARVTIFPAPVFAQSLPSLAPVQSSRPAHSLTPISRPRLSISGSRA